MQAMDYRTEEIIKAFPGLCYDKHFKITSPEDPDYNCIAWSFSRKDCWLWPDEDVDGVDIWPQEAANNPTLRFFIDAYKTGGFTVCNSEQLEESKEKIALYAHPDTEECTHASRQLPNGLWTSKLGPSFDITHSTPYTIQGRLYGMVACIMSRDI